MCNSKSWMLQALDIVLIVDMAVCYKCVRWTLDILPIFMLLGFAEKCVLLCHLCPQRFSRPRRSPNAFGLGQMQKGKNTSNPSPKAIERHRNTFPSERRQMESPSPGLGKRKHRVLEPCCFSFFREPLYNAGFKKKHTQDFRIAHRCSLGRPLNWSHLQSCKSFHHISSLFIVCSQTKKTRGTIHHCKEKPISWP